MGFDFKWLILGWEGKLTYLKSFLPPPTSFLPHMYVWVKNFYNETKNIVRNVESLEWKTIWNVGGKSTLVGKVDEKWKWLKSWRGQKNWLFKFQKQFCRSMWQMEVDEECHEGPSGPK